LKSNTNSLNQLGKRSSYNKLEQKLSSKTLINEGALKQKKSNTTRLPKNGQQPDKQSSPIWEGHPQQQKRRWQLSKQIKKDISYKTTTG